MRLIISPLAPPPGQSFFVRAPSHPSRGEKTKKTLQILRDCPTVFQPLPLLTLKTIIREDKYAPQMHSYRKNRLHSGNGRPNPFRSIIRPIDSGGGARSAGRGPTAGRELRHGRLRVLMSSWTLAGAAAARQGSSCLHPVSIGSQN